MKWIEIEKELPPERKYVLAKHNRVTWDAPHPTPDDQTNVNKVVVKLIKGMSQIERQLMKVNDPTNERSKMSRFGDEEEDNNKVSFAWCSFGPDRFFGQEITHWSHIPGDEE